MNSTPATTPLSVRERVNDYMNSMETAGIKSVYFEIDYEDLDIRADPYGSALSVVASRFFRTTDVAETFMAASGRHENADNTLLMTPALLRIGESRQPPLGRWFWNFADDTLRYLGE